MNIKPFFLLGMLATSSGMCEIFPSNSIVENYNGVQDNGVQVVNANTVQGNNLAQENAIARQNVALLHAVRAHIANANNPQHLAFVVSLEQTPYTVGVLVANANNPQHLALHVINMEPIIQLVMRSPEPRNRLMQIAVFCEIIQFLMGQPQLVANFLANENNQAFALLAYIGSTMIRARLHHDARYCHDIVAFLQRLKDFIDQQNAIVMRNNATNIQLLRSVRGMLDEMTARPDGRLLLATAAEILGLMQGNANDAQSLDPALFLRRTVVHMRNEPNANERLCEVFRVLRGVQSIFDNLNPMQLLTQLRQHLYNAQPWQHSNNSPLVPHSNNVPDNNYEQQSIVLSLIRGTLRGMCSSSNRTIRAAIVREYLPAIGNLSDIANNAQQISRELSVAEIIQNIIHRPDATANLLNALVFLQMVQIACDNPRYARVFQRSLSWGNANNVQRLQRLNSVLDTILRFQMGHSILHNANNAQLFRRLVLL